MRIILRVLQKSEPYDYSKRGKIGMAKMWGGAAKPSRDEFDKLTRPHVDMLFRVAQRMSSDRHSAEDLVQETCLKAFRGFASFKPGTNYKAWLCRIMTNISIDISRRHANVSFVEWDEGNVANMSDAQLLGYNDQANNPEIHFLHKSFKDDAVRAMARLSPEIRIVVALALLEELSYEEISQTVGCPIGTVRSRLSRGRKQLQHYLNDYLPRPKITGNENKQLNTQPKGDKV